MAGLVVLIVCILPFVTSEDFLQDDEMHDGILRAQCTARCLEKYGTTVVKHKDDIYPQYSHKACIRHGCRQCMVACNTTVLELEDCTAVCENRTACSHSCHFFIRESDRMETNEAMLPHAIDKPQILCMDIPYSRNGDNVCRQKVVRLSLKWRTKPEVMRKSTTYVISVREKDPENDSPLDWQVLQIVSSAFSRLKNLSCDTKYQFKVTPVSRLGVIGQSNESDWILTPSESRHIQAPTNLRVLRQAIYHQRPSAVIAWEGNQESSCFYRVYWMSKGSEEAEIKAPPEFKYRIKGLQFSTNYTVRLYSYDAEYTKGSKEGAMTSFHTADCLQATVYNYTVCPPEAPGNITMTVLTALPEDHNVDYVNISLSWSPPSHTDNGEEVLQYLLEWRKEPPIHAGHLIVPHYDTMQINATATTPPDTTITVYNLHNHNQYSVMLAAKTRGGLGTVAKMIVSLGLPLANKTAEELQSTMKSIYPLPLSSAELLAVVLIPIVLCITLIMATCLYVKKRKQSKHNAATKGCGAMEELNPIYDGIVACAVPFEENQESFETDSYEIDFKCLTFIKVLGEGAFGKVMEAEFYERPSDKGHKNGKIVAVKMLRDIYTNVELRHFKLEIEAMKTLGSHPQLVGIIGCCLSGPKLCFVMEYCALGDLRNYLRKYREKMQYSLVSPTATRQSLPSDTSETALVSSDSGISQESDDVIEHQTGNTEDISEAQLLSYARQITMGMEFLEERKFVHRDLAARNILLVDRRYIKISDFGLTRDVYETSMYQPTSARRLPYKWMALESLFSQGFTIKSDVWSFGIVMWEIVTLGGSPYPSVPLKDLYGLLKDGYRMERPENCSPSIYQIMLACWHPNPVSRPNFGELRNQLEALLEETESYIDLSIAVSGDYFHNDSTTGSQNTNSSSRVPYPYPKKREENCHTEKECLAEIHGPSQSADKDNNFSKDSSIPALEPGDDEVFLDSDSKNNFCLFNLDNHLKEKTLEEDVLLNNNKKCKCVLCVNRDSLKSTKSNSSSVQPLKHKLSFRDSLKNIIEKVGKTNKLFLPLSRKRSFSLTDMDKGEKCTIYL